MAAHGCPQVTFELMLVSLSHTDSVEDDFELSTVCHRPESMDKLQEQTKFTKKELQVLYRGFKNVGLAAEWTKKAGMEINKYGYNFITIEV